MSDHSSSQSSHGSQGDDHGSGLRGLGPVLLGLVGVAGLAGWIVAEGGPEKWFSNNPLIAAVIGIGLLLAFRSVRGAIGSLFSFWTVGLFIIGMFAGQVVRTWFERGIGDTGDLPILWSIGGGLLFSLLRLFRGGGDSGKKSDHHH